MTMTSALQKSQGPEEQSRIGGLHIGHGGWKSLCKALCLGEFGPNPWASLQEELVLTGCAGKAAQVVMKILFLLGY